MTAARLQGLQMAGDLLLLKFPLLLVLRGRLRTLLPVSTGNEAAC